jgi:hypothetical protein
MFGYMNPRPFPLRRIFDEVATAAEINVRQHIFRSLSETVRERGGCLLKQSVDVNALRVIVGFQISASCFVNLSIC